MLLKQAMPKHGDKLCMTMAESVACEKGVFRPGCRITYGWFERFMKRQPQLSLRIWDATANVRIDSVNPEAMTQYFDLVNDVLDDGRKAKLERIYKVDVTGVFL